MTAFVDYAWWQVSPAQLRSMGFSGAMRYCSHDGSKNLTLAELVNLRNADFDLGIVFESTANRSAQGSAAGAADGAFANAFADSLGYPSSCTLWYAVDFDASPAQVQAYFDGIGSAGGRPYAPYGSASVIAGVRYPGVGWQTAAWSRGSVSGRAGLLQNGFHNSYDSNAVLVADFGQWRAGAQPTPSPTPALKEDDMAAIRIPAPTNASKTDPAGNDATTRVPDAPFERGTLRLFGKGIVSVTTDQFPSTADGALCRVAIGSPEDGWGIEEKWIGADPWEVAYDTTPMKGKPEIAVTVYGLTAGDVTINAVQVG